MIEIFRENSLQLKAFTLGPRNVSGIQIDPNTKYGTKRDVIEAYSESIQTSKVEPFSEIVDGFQPLNILVKSSNLDV